MYILNGLSLVLELELNIPNIARKYIGGCRKQPIDYHSHFANQSASSLIKLKPSECINFLISFGSLNIDLMFYIFEIAEVAILSIDLVKYLPAHKQKSENIFGLFFGWSKLEHKSFSGQ